MFRFQREQVSFDVSGTMFGGQPGRRAPVMIGSVYYPGHSIVLDRKAGKVDIEKLEERVSRAEDCARGFQQGHGCMAYLDHVDAVHGLLSSLSDASCGPIFIDSPDPRVKLKALEEAESMGVSSRVIYNSLHVGSPPEEWSSLVEHGVDSSVVMAFDPGDLTVKGRIYLLDNGGRLLRKGLLDTAEEFGIKRPLIDLAATSFDQSAGSALRALTVAKAKWGLPSGMALHNTVETWSPFQEMDDEGKKLFRYVDTAAVTVAMMSGADWVMYGALESSQRVLHAAAFTSGVMAQAVEDIW